MPRSLVVGCLHVLLPVITRIVNFSLSSGYFLVEWKEALVFPLLKKAGLYPAFKNLRPVSNLQFLSKLRERAVFDQMYNLIHIKNPSMYGLRSNSELLFAPPSTKTKKTFGDRAFTAAAPSLWNKLLSEIRDEDNFERLKSKLKTILFRAAHPIKST